MVYCWFGPVLILDPLSWREIGLLLDELERVTAALCSCTLLIENVGFNRCNIYWCNKHSHVHTAPWQLQLWYSHVSSYISLSKMYRTANMFLCTKHVVFSLCAKGCEQSVVKLIFSGIVKAKFGTVREPRTIICPRGKIQEWRGRNDEGLKCWPDTMDGTLCRRETGLGLCSSSLTERERPLLLWWALASCLEVEHNASEVIRGIMIYWVASPLRLEHKFGVGSIRTLWSDRFCVLSISCVTEIGDIGYIIISDLWIRPPVCVCIHQCGPLSQYSVSLFKPFSSFILPNGLIQWRHFH